MPDLITWLEQWYRHHCNGDWERYHHVRIETLDNPGWFVSIDLEGTALITQSFVPPVAGQDEQANTWIYCHVQDGVFKGYGGPLNAILHVFKEWCEPSPLFTRQEFEQSYDQLAGTDMLPIRVDQFNGEADFTGNPEQRLDVIYGAKADFPSALHFWGRCVRFRFYRTWNYLALHSSDLARIWPGPETTLRQNAINSKTTLRRPMTQDGFWSVVHEHTGQLRRSFSLTLPGEFVAAMTMCDEWNTQEVLCQATTGYVAFCWETSV